MKKIFLLLTLFLMPMSVKAISYNTPVGSDLTYDQCIKFQDNSITTSTNGYFGHCLKATCYGGTWQTQYYISENMVKCSNGNTNKYYHVMSSGCGSYYGNCTPTTRIKYCSVIAFYDCSKTADGQPYIAPTTTTTTTKAPTTKKPTTKRPGGTTTTTTTTTTQAKEENTFLSALSLSEGKINFVKTTSDYTIEIAEDTKSIEVKAAPEDTSAKVLIENNTDIKLDVPIKITVTGVKGTTRVYTINMKKAEAKLDSNTKLASLKITGYKIDFDADNHSYEIKLTGNETKLELAIEPESKTTTYEVIGNENLKHKSKIQIMLTAENGDEDYYMINIKKSSSIGKVFIFLIIFGIIGFVAFKLIKKLTLKKEETNYEYE